jgi:predicted transcriptional regulator YdeE
MEHRIESRGSLTFLGVQDVVRREPDFFQRLWRERFTPREGDVRSLSRDCGFFGVTYMIEDEVFYLAGMLVPPKTVAPDGLVAATVPAATYVVVECSMEHIGRTYHTIYQDLLAQVGMEDDQRAADFERYPPPDSPTDTVEIWVSARQKASE